MKCNLGCTREEYWKITNNEYSVPHNGPTTLDEIKEEKFNIRANEELLSSLSNSEMTNVMDLEISHEMWIKLETLYEGCNAHQNTLKKLNNNIQMEIIGFLMNI